MTISLGLALSSGADAVDEADLIKAGGRRPLRGEAARPRPWRSIRTRITDARARRRRRDASPPQTWNHRPLRPACAGVAGNRDRDRRRLRRRPVVAGEHGRRGARRGHATARADRRRRRDERLPVSEGVRRRVPAVRQPRLAGRAGDEQAGLRVLAGRRPRQGRQSRRGQTARRDRERVRRLRSARARRQSPSTIRESATRPATPSRPITRVRSGCGISSTNSAGMARQDAERALAETERSVGRLAHVLVGTSIAGAIASLVVGFLWARRITRPIYELEVQVQSSTERTRIQVAPGRAGLEALGDQVTALVEKLEETDAALAEHRRRLMQSEKLSAVGELAAKLAHEVLNPLAGMKAAVQLLARQGAAGAAAATCSTTAEALNREITRVEGLVRRLVNFSRPLAPRVEVAAWARCSTRRMEAASRFSSGMRSAVERPRRRICEPVEVDPLLFTQVLVNLLVNAAEAMAPAGGRRGAERATRAARPRARRDRHPRRRPRTGHPRRAPPRAVQALLHDQARGARTGPGGQPEHRARARRPDRRRRTAPPAGDGRRLRGRSSRSRCR